MVVISLLIAVAISRGSAAAPGPAQDANVADYSIASVEYLPGPLEKVGKLRAGLLCLPKGTLRWRDVARPADDVLIGRMSDVLIEQGLSVAARADALFGDPIPATRFRVRVVVEQVKMRLCIAGLGIGEKQPSGEGTARVRWETFDRIGRVQVDAATFDVPMIVAGRDARGSSGVLGDAIAESARLYAAPRVR